MMGILDKVLVWEAAGVPSVRRDQGLFPVPAGSKRDPMTGQS